MHDFIQNLSFNSQPPLPATRPTGEVLRSVMRSFDSEVPFTAYRPVPRPSSRTKRRAAKPSLLTKNS
jgi:hypothetical protein